MHPILISRGRLLGYLAVWVAFGLLLSGVMLGAKAPLQWSLLFSVPLAVLLGLQSLSFWYVVQAMPPGHTPPVRMALIWFAAGCRHAGDLAGPVVCMVAVSVAAGARVP